jgi:hypothetical protein
MFYECKYRSTWQAELLNWGTSEGASSTESSFRGRGKEKRGRSKKEGKKENKIGS